MKKFMAIGLLFGSLYAQELAPGGNFMIPIMGGEANVEVTTGGNYIVELWHVGGGNFHVNREQSEQIFFQLQRQLPRTQAQSLRDRAENLPVRPQEARSVNNERTLWDKFLDLFR